MITYGRGAIYAFECCNYPVYLCSSFDEFFCLRVVLTPSPRIPLRLYTLSYWSNAPFLIFDIRALWRWGLSARAPGRQKLKMVDYTSMTLDPSNSSNLQQLALKSLIFRSTNALVPFQGHQISWVSDWLSTRFFSPWSSSAMEAAKEAKFGTKVA